MLRLLQLFQSINGSKTYLASGVLSLAGVVILLFGGDSRWALSLLAQGGGLAALRHAVAKLHDQLNPLPVETKTNS